MYCDIIDGKIINPSTFEGSRKFDIDYHYYISCAKGYLIYDETLDDIIINPHWQELEQQQIINQQIEECQKELEEIDKKRIRAICEPSIKNELTNETWLDYYNNKVLEIREKINNLL